MFGKMHMNKIQLTLFALFVTSILSAQLFVGGESACLDKKLLDPAYPMMEDWAKAGVEGGIPERGKLKICREITSGNDINQAMLQVSDMGGGVLLLREGVYTVNETLEVPSGVVLRGADRENVILSVKMKGRFSKGRTVTTAALSCNNVIRAGIEDLTIKYEAADFEPVDKSHVYDTWTEDVFHKKEMRDTSLFVVSVWFENARNCWLDNCRILCSGDDPVRITNSTHITCRKNFIDRCYNKCDGGMGYYNIINSSYILSCYEKVRRIRHFAVHLGSKYCVAVNNDFEVDVNFHDGDEGYNLIENNRIIIPVWHSWHCFQMGAPNLHRAPGAWNVLYNNFAYFKLAGPEYSERDVVYLMNTKFDAEKIIKTDLSAPVGGTFYPVVVK